MDAFIVAMSLVPLLLPSQNTGVVRILRALRILRLFRRVPSLRKIVAAITSALLPVANVFCILFLLISICETPLVFPLTVWMSEREGGRKGRKECMG